MSDFTADEWYRSNDTGASSETIWSVMTGNPVKHYSIPLDPSDFGRCRRLLQAFPAWRASLGEVAVRFPEWAPFVAAWDEMDRLYERDEPTGTSRELYALMARLRGGA